MNETTPELIETVEPVVEAPVVPVEIPAPAPVAKRHEYQPVDDQGRAIGGKQVIIYHSEQELIEKLTKNHSESIRAMRETRRKQRLGINDEDTLPSDIDRLPSTVQFKQRELTLEERYALSQDLNDPQKMGDAGDRLIEATLGAKPQEIRDTINGLQRSTQELLARQNALTWIDRHPEFYNCEENLSTVCDWMVKNGLQPTVKNFEFAQAKMDEAGLLLSSPIVREVPPARTAETVQLPPAPVAESTRISEVPQPQQPNVTQARVPSGLNNRVSSNAGVNPPSGSAALTLKDVENMSSQEYKLRLTTDPEFVKRVNELEAARPQRPRGR